MKREAIGRLGYFSLDGGEFVFPLTQAIQILRSEAVRLEFGELGENTARALEVWARTEVLTFSGNHYDFLNKYYASFADSCGISRARTDGDIAAHGDKCCQYRNQWEEAGIPFHCGVAVYLLTYHPPYDQEVRSTVDGWVAPHTWVIDNYHRFSSRLNNIIDSDTVISPNTEG